MDLHPQRVPVIGNANSANEMAAQLAPVTSSCSPVYRSTRRVSTSPFLPDTRGQDRLHNSLQHQHKRQHHSKHPGRKCYRGHRCCFIRNRLLPKCTQLPNPSPRVAHTHTSTITPSYIPSLLPPPPNLLRAQSHTAFMAATISFIPFFSQTSQAPGQCSHGP
jgi:hypothetical protein